MERPIPTRFGASVALLAAALVVGSGATTLAQADEEGANAIAPTGPLGVPYSEWSDRYWRSWSTPQRTPPEQDCQLAYDGEVFFLLTNQVTLVSPEELEAMRAGAPTGCTVPAGQPILLVVGDISCDVDVRLAARIERATKDGEKKRANKARRKLDQAGAEVFRTCLTDDSPFSSARPVLKVDGIDVALDESYAQLSGPFQEGPYRVWRRGYVVMLEPLSPGFHEIVAGRDPGVGELVEGRDVLTHPYRRR